MLTMIAMMLAAATPSGDCSTAAVQGALTAAVEAQRHHDDAAAKAAITPAAACPVADGQTYAAHVLRADIAAHEADWPTVRAMLGETGMHPETTLGVRVQFLLMRADQGLSDAAAFAADRALTVVADDARLAAAGKTLESFRVGAADVTAYSAEFDQGAFHRVIEFIAVPDDKTLYPVSVMLTDDRSVASIMKEMNKGSAASAHAWFIDLYYCTGHRNITPPAAAAATLGTEPDYAAVKARVVEIVGGKDAFAAKPPERGACPAANWMMPGFGLRK